MTCYVFCFHFTWNLGHTIWSKSLYLTWMLAAQWSCVNTSWLFVVVFSAVTKSDLLALACNVASIVTAVRERFPVQFVLQSNQTESVLIYCNLAETATALWISMFIGHSYRIMLVQQKILKTLFQTLNLAQTWSELDAVKMKWLGGNKKDLEQSTSLWYLSPTHGFFGNWFCLNSPIDMQVSKQVGGSPLCLWFVFHKQHVRDDGKDGD